MSLAGSLLGDDGRLLVVAIDHPLYSWPCPGLEDRASVLRATADAGADAFIASYGTVRDHRQSFGSAKAILKLDLTAVTVAGSYPVTEYVLGYTLEDAQRLDAAAVLTFVQLGAPFELEALRTAARVAAAADRAGLPYVCEIMPVGGPQYPDLSAPVAIAAAARTAAELGAHIVKTTMPVPVVGVADVVGCGTPVIFAGGELTADPDGMLGDIAEALEAGAAGVAHGRNVWGSNDPAAAVAALHALIHPAVTTHD